MAETDNLIRMAGEAMFGNQWKAPLSREIGVSRDSVQDWDQGRMSPRPGVYVAVLEKARQRLETLQSAVDSLDRHVKGGRG